MPIEDTLESNGLPVNSKVMLGRLEEILEMHNTNCLANIKDDERVRRVMWLLNYQVYGLCAIIDMGDEWRELTGND